MMERVQTFIGEIARPVAIISTSLSASIATVIVAQKVTDGNDGAILMGAIFVGVGALYGFKAAENWKAKKADADVEIAKAAGEK